MKILPNLPGLLFLARNVLWANTYASGIDYMREHNDLKTEKNMIKEVITGWSRRIIEKFGWTINASGLENLPKDGPVLFVSNHQGFADVLPFMYYVPFQVGFIAKSELKKIPVFNNWITRIRGIFINRSDARESIKTIGEGAEYLKRGFSMVIFPEGTRTKDENHAMGEFHHGSFKLATKAKVPIVPVTINGSYKCFEETGIIQKNQSFDVTFHEPIETGGMDRQELKELPEKVRDIIQSAL